MLVVTPSFTLTVLPNHTHLGSYTPTVSLHGVSLAPVISVSFHAAHDHTSSKNAAKIYHGSRIPRIGHR